MNISLALQNAKKFNAGRRWNRPGKLKIADIEPSVVRDAMVNSKMVQGIIEGMMASTGCNREVAEDALLRAHNLGELLTPAELAERLKADVSWVQEKTRKRCKDPIPSIPMGRIIRFDWDAVVKWMEKKAAGNGNTTKPAAVRNTRKV